MEQKDSRFAVLIDADNVSPKYIKYILDEVSDQGVATYKRIYGDWTDISKKSWKEQLLRYSIRSSSTAIRTEKIQLTPR